MNRQFISKLLALLAGIVLIFVAYNHNQNSIYIINGNAYGTTWSVKSSEYIGDKHKENIINIIDRIDYVASNYKENSEISLINQNTNNFHFVSTDLFNILSIAKEVEIQSLGFYNILLGKISSNLGFAPTFGKELVHKKNSSFKLNEKNQSLEKLSSNWFDLSSIAKGYAVQEIHNYLVKEKLVNHLIDIGGEIIANGNNAGKSWKIGIQNPFSISDNASIIVDNKFKFLAIASSGEYRNYKSDKYGNKLTHTINPKTLKSIDNEIVSVSVISKTSATYADAYSTAFNAMGSELALKIANKEDIALMLMINDNDNVEILYSNKWYDEIL